MSFNATDNILIQDFTYMDVFLLNSHSGGGESKLGSLRISATSGLSYLPQVIVEDGEFGGMKIGRGNQSTWRKPAPAPLCPPQIPLNQTWVQTRRCRGGKPAANRLNYGMALKIHMDFILPLIYFSS
jgi:hypothetical protein